MNFNELKSRDISNKKLSNFLTELNNTSITNRKLVGKKVIETLCEDSNSGWLIRNVNLQIENTSEIIEKISKYLYSGKGAYSQGFKRILKTTYIDHQNYPEKSTYYFYWELDKSS